MSYTRDDLITAALGSMGIVRLTDSSATLTTVALVANAARMLGVLPSGQTLSAEDSDIITPRVATVIADLNARAIVTISNENAIPGGMFDALSTLVANAAKHAYELAGEATKQISADALMAERKLYSFGGAVLIDDALDAIFAELASDDLVNVVDDSEIPDEWFQSLADIVADRVVGHFPLLTPDVVARVKAEGAQAMDTLRRITRGRPSYNIAIPTWI